MRISDWSSDVCASDLSRSLGYGAAKGRPERPPTRETSMRRLAFVASIIGAIMSMDSSGAAAASPEDTLYMDLKSGRVVIELRSDLAPKHVARIKERSEEHTSDLQSLMRNSYAVF